MSGTRYGHKLRARLNKGYRKMNNINGGIKTDFHYHLEPGQIDVDGLAEIFYSSAEKIRVQFYRRGIIRSIGKVGTKIVFDKIQATAILSKYVREDGQLTFKKYKPKKFFK